MNFRTSLFLTFLFTFSLVACDSRYVVIGIVRDTNNNALQDVKVEFYYPESSKTRSAATDEKGEFDLTFISGWTDQDGYLLASKDGFKKQSMSYVAGRDGRIEVVLEPVE